MYSFKKRNGVNKMDSKRVGHEMSIIHEVNDVKGIKWIHKGKLYQNYSINS